MNFPIQYIVDEQLNKKAVIVPYAEWQNILEAIEKLDDIHAYEQAKADHNDDNMPFEQAVAEIKSGMIE
ncbi:hypothetical protein Thiowin_01453 [Thiorhodovibrio winogradskyi]|uniref:Uncharacterized protein n=1 Tax=Thiorhodovibrio winogradskyi TaxID=77007 RepID=A0ABZ0S8S8_9GAMM|nr:hypothetical protein [Thiorhodovibrio winogradskyi]